MNKPTRKAQHLLYGKPLTPQQLLFGTTYLANGFNVRQRLLRNPALRAWINDRLEDAWRPLKMGAEQALAVVALLASYDVGELYDERGRMLPAHQWPDAVRLCIKSIKDGPAGVTVTMHDKLAALRTILEQLGKLKTPGDSMDALADAIRADRKTHGIDQ